MSFFRNAYLILCLAVFLAGSIMSGALVMHSLFTGYAVTVYTNNYGEAWFEAVIVIMTLPGILYLSYRAASLLEWPRITFTWPKPIRRQEVQE